jgi:hypothetical protein
MNATEMQYRAFLAVVVAALIVALAPIVTSGLRGEALPDALIAIADKSVVAFAGLLGTIGALLFRQNQVDTDRVDNTSKALDAIAAAQASMPPQAGPTRTPTDPISTQDVGQ